jgi:3-methyl-2-oxobutanoate hydroxymethyltransferase
MPEPAAWPADRRITITDLQAATDRGERWSMLTSYDTLTAGVFEQAGVRALLVGDTSAEMVLGFQTTGRLPRFVKRYASLRETLLDATRRFTDDVSDGRYPDAEHSYT